LKFKIYKTIIFPVILCGCETWSLTLKEEHRLKVSENRVLRRIFGPKSEEVAGYWRRLHSEKVQNLYAIPTIRVIKSRRIRLADNVARIREIRNAHSILFGKPEWKRPL
jgi:hypothetical protein